MITPDFETRSYADLAKTGAWVYSQDETTEVICLCWGIDSEPRQRWWPDTPEFPELPGWQLRSSDGTRNGIPRDLKAAIESGDEFEAHNVVFEFSIWMNICVKRWGWPPLAIKQLRDSMATACYYSLPAKLDKLAMVLGFEGKHKDGGRLINKYSKLYNKNSKKVIPHEDFWLWVDYCDQDVAVEQSVSDYLGDLPERELPIFHLNLEVGLRGLCLDLEGIENATAVVAARSDDFTEEFKRLTGGGDPKKGLKPTQRDRVMEWFAANGLELENMQGEYLGELLDDEVNPIPSGPVRRALEIRLKLNKASTKKLDAMARQRDGQGRSRFQTRYHGAGTGRETASGWQVLNLSRGFEEINPEQLVRDISYRDPAWLDSLYGDAMDAIGKASRHWIMAGPGKQIMSGDFVSIEAVVLACLAGEEWKVKAFANKLPLYEVMGAKIHGLPPEVALEKGPDGKYTFKKKYPAFRQDGKVGELAFGYQGALNAWLNFDSSGRYTDEEIITICKSWRSEHPMIRQFWKDLEWASIDAVRHGPGKIFQAGRSPIHFEVVDEWLSMILPDCKRIWYWQPELRMGMPSWHKPMESEDCAAGACDCRPRPQLTYMAQKFGKWRRVWTYGGKLAENATQATSRQILFPAAQRLKANGYSIILTVYDELVCEEDIGRDEKEFKQIIGECPGEFALGWPIGVDTWVGRRYKK